METNYDLKKFVTLNGANAISRAEAKNYIKQTADVTEEDSLVDTMIESALNEAQNVTNKLMNTEASVKCIIDVIGSENGVYSFDLPFENVEIESLTSLSAIDTDGDEVAITASDYQLRGNTIVFKGFYMAGYRITLTYDISVAASFLLPYKEALLAYVGYKYMNRTTSTQKKAVELFSNHISYKGWI